MTTSRTRRVCLHLPPVTRAIQNTRLWFAAARPLDTKDSLHRLFRTRQELMTAYGNEPEFSILHVTRAQAKAIMQKHNAAVDAYVNRGLCQRCHAPSAHNPCDDCMDQMYEDAAARQWEEYCQRLDALPPYAKWVDLLALRVRYWSEQKAGVIALS